MDWKKFLRGLGVAFLDGALAAGAGAVAGVMTGTPIDPKALGVIAIAGGATSVRRFLQNPNSETAVGELPSILPPKP